MRSSSGLMAMAIVVAPSSSGYVLTFGFRRFITLVWRVLTPSLGRTIPPLKSSPAGSAVRPYSSTARLDRKANVGLAPAKSVCGVEPKTNVVGWGQFQKGTEGLMAEAASIPRAEGARPAAIASEPSAATMAPLSVQSAGGGVRS